MFHKYWEKPTEIENERVRTEKKIKLVFCEV